MKNLIRSIVPSLLLVIASAAYGGVPAMNVTVSDASGKAAFKGATTAKGTFTTSKLQPGKYVVQLNSKGAMKGNHYTIVVGAGTKKVSANAVPGEKFNGGGVALKVDVAAGLNITGQVAEEAPGAGNVAGGKKKIWIPKQPGSNLPGHWVEEGSAEAVTARTSGTLDSQGVQNMQDRGRTPGN